MDTVFLVLRVVISLGAVLGVIWFIQRKISTGKTGTRENRITVVGRQSVGGKASVAMVDVDGKRYLVGVTEHSVNLLDVINPRLSFDADTPQAACARVMANTTGPITVQASASRVAITGSIPVQQVAATVPPAQAPAMVRDRRALRAEPGKSPIAGSILSPATWRQTAAVFRQAR